MNRFIHGIHDADGAELMADKPGWITFTEAIGCDPKDTSGINYHAWASRGYGVIVRLNNGYYSEHHHPGTIPTPDRYDDFAVRCANFVAASDGCEIVIIGNEPNMTAETANQAGIQPADYARCYQKCRQAIRRVKPQCQVLVAGCAPWNQQSGDWLDYWRVVLVNVDDECDGVSIHTYSHGTDPSLITSEEMVHGWHWHFRVYQDQLEAMPAILYGLPVYITETDQDDAWADVNSGWVQNAYAEIDRWNQTNVPAIHALCLFRSLPADHWSFAAKNGVKADFRAAVERGYTVPVAGTPGVPTPPEPTPEPPTPAPGPEPEPPRDIDPALALRGVHFEFAKVPEGTGYWRIVAASWLDEQEADAVGPDHHILGKTLRDGVEIAGLPLIVNWPSGTHTIYSKGDDPNASYSYDYPMGPSLNEYSIAVADGNPTDKASGIGMGMGGNPREHSSTWLTFEWTIASGSTPPIPPPLPGRALVHPLPGAVITQRFGENPENYKQFGQSAHNGVDLGNRPERTPVCCIADGEVAYIGFDERGYGFYCRVMHRQLNAYSFYAHLAVAATVAIGQPVEGGQTVGLLGSTGNSSGVHLHLEIREMNPDGSYAEGQYGYTQGRVDPETVFHVLGGKL